MTRRTVSAASTRARRALRGQRDDGGDDQLLLLRVSAGGDAAGGGGVLAARRPSGLSQPDDERERADREPAAVQAAWADALDIGHDPDGQAFHRPAERRGEHRAVRLPGAVSRPAHRAVHLG